MGCSKTLELWRHQVHKLSTKKLKNKIASFLTTTTKSYKLAFLVRFWLLLVKLSSGNTLWYHSFVLRVKIGHLAFYVTFGPI